MAYCLVKPLADSFKQALRDGRIDPQRLADMSSEERRAFFEEIVGEDNAPNVNALFEKKLLMSDVQQGMISWAKEVTGIQPEVRNSLIDRIQKMDSRILDPVNQKAFLEDLAAKRLGTEVTLEEAKHITDLSKTLTETKEKFDPKTEKWTSEQDRLEYGSARVALDDYLKDVKRENQAISIDSFKENPFGASAQIISRTAGLAKSLKATLDLSAIGRQGFKMMFTHPKLWLDNAQKTFLDAYKELKTRTDDNGVLNAIKADIFSRPNAMNGNYGRMKVDIGGGEEAFPESLPEKIPALGRVFKASETAYNGFLLRARADIADAEIKAAMDNGIDLKDKKEAESLGKVINALTGRGHLGPFEGAGKVINNVFFSPKNFKANVDFLTAHAFDGTSWYAKKRAAMNLLRVAGSIAAFMAIAKALHPDQTETDSRSSDFGKFKIGDTRYDFTGGLGSLATLVSRLASQSSKSSVTGKVSQLGSGYGEQSVWDVFGSFLGNKLSPSASFAKDIYLKHDSLGKPITPQGEVSNMFMPLPITNAIELLNNPNTSVQRAVVSVLLDALGVATNTYQDTSSLGTTLSDNQALTKQLHDLSNEVGKPISFTNWDSTNKADIGAFKAKVSDSEYQDAKQRYIFQVKTRLDEVLSNPKYKNLSNEDKVRVLNQVDQEAINKVFSQFNFKYKRPPIKKVKL